jgi:gliding motility-associated-like protein
LNVSVTSPQNICEGEHATLTAVASGGNGGPYTYVWNMGTGNPNVVSPETTTSYQVNVYDNCGTPTDSASTAVYVHRMPVLLTIDSAAGCEPLTVTFKPQIYYDTSETMPTYEWMFYDQIGSGGSSNDTMPTHEYMNDGIYDVELILTSQYGCKSDTVVKELVTVYPVPNSTFTMDPQAAGVFDAEIQFFDNSEPDIAQWYWSFGDSSYSLMQNPIHTYEDAGTYEVQLIVGTSHQCYDTSSVLMRIKPEHTFYPPTAFSPGTGYSNNYWYPKGIGIDGKNYHLWIYDRWGQVIYETDVKPAGTESVVEVEGGWNGRYQNTGKPVPNDTYVWLVILKDVNGEEHHYSGTVTVVK